MARTSSSKASGRKVDRPSSSSAAISKRMQATRRRDTREELALRSALYARGVRFRVDAALPGMRRRADVLFSRLRIAVFVDGCFWHGCPQHGTWPKANAAWWRKKIAGNMQRDRDTDTKLRQAGWLVFRFWAHEDPNRAAIKVLAAVRRRRRGFGGVAACKAPRLG
jgi:DNA mismatch endonuclease (patch repair protein)